jgi:hypothetical protein
MKHDACTHPRTPAGRAACRKGSQINAEAPTGATPKATRNTAVKSPRRTLKAPGQLIRINAIDVPDPLRPWIKLATENNLDVAAGSPYTESQRVVRIVGESGTLQLVWNETLPFGVADVQYRPHNSSVSRRMPTINEGFRVLGV